MPIPSPSQNEDRDEFIERCMEDETMRDEFPDSDQRLGVCETQWEGGKMKLKHLDFEMKAEDVADDGSFSGYGAVFDNVDAYAERIERGAFKNTLKAHKERGSMPKLLWQHDPRMPIGIYTEMSEDNRGLKVKGQLNLDVRQGREAHSLMKQKAVDGLSIGFIPKKWEDDQESDIRTLTEIDLWETSIVTFPANPEAQVEAVRSHLEAGEVPSKRDVEAILRDAGFSQRQAKALVARGYEGLRHRDGDNPDLEALSEAIDKFRQIAA